MPFLTVAEAKSAFTERRGRTSDAMFKTARTILQEDHVQTLRSHDHFDVFLSHATEDDEAVGGVKQLLERRKLVVYEDSGDQELDRDNISERTADVLRKRLRFSALLLFVTSSRSPRSMWMPWELGFFDGFKPNHIAILPLVQNSYESFKGQEYLGLYPLIQNLNVQGGGRDLGILIEETTYVPVEQFVRYGITSYYRDHA